MLISLFIHILCVAFDCVDFINCRLEEGSLNALFENLVTLLVNQLF
jgi:hypothetical protein